MPVKIFSVHLLMIAITIAAPDLPRLAKLFLLNQPVPPADLGAALDLPRLVHVWQFVKVALLALMVGFIAYNLLPLQKEAAGLTAGLALQGTYRVEEFRTANLAPWTEVIFDSLEGNKPTVTTHDNSGSVSSYSFVADDRSLTLIDGTGARTELQIRKPKPDTLELSGTWSGVPLQVRLRRQYGGLRLEQRGFHWVNEFPFNP